MTDTRANPNDLVTFLRARIDDDEATARRGFSHPERWVRVAPTGTPNGLSCSAVLREVEAKRAVVRAYLDAKAYYDAHPEADAGEVTGLYTAVRLLAQVWDDHPDYRSEWRP